MGEIFSLQMRSITYKNLMWHDDPSPTEAALHQLQKQYDFHELDIEDCLSEHERPKIEEYENYLFLVFHIPYVSKNTGRVLKEEVNIFLGQDFIITLHEGKIATIDLVWTQLQQSRTKRLDYLEQGTGFFLYELMNRLFTEGFPIVDSMTRQLRRLEDELFEREEEVDLLRSLMTLKRNIITMRSILLPQRALVAQLEHKQKKFITDALALYFDDVVDAIERQWSLLETAKEFIYPLQDTHESWLSHKTNAVIRTLTVFSVTMLPLTFLTGLYGMNVYLPFHDHPLAFFGLIGIMATIVLGLLWYFVRKHWL